MSASADDQYEAQNDRSGDGPTGNPTDNDYKSRTGQNQIPVDSDEAPVNDPIDPATADSDETLARDEKDAINEDNIIDERTRGAAKKQGTYREPGDDEGLPGPEDGTSSGRQ